MKGTIRSLKKTLCLLCAALVPSGAPLPAAAISPGKPKSAEKAVEAPAEKQTSPQAAPKAAEAAPADPGGRDWSGKPDSWNNWVWVAPMRKQGNEWASFCESGQRAFVRASDYERDRNRGRLNRTMNRYWNGDDKGWIRVPLYCIEDNPTAQRQQSKGAPRNLPRYEASRSPYDFQMKLGVFQAVRTVPDGQGNSTEVHIDAATQRMQAKELAVHWTSRYADPERKTPRKQASPAKPAEVRRGAADAKRDHAPPPAEREMEKPRAEAAGDINRQTIQRAIEKLFPDPEYGKAERAVIEYLAGKSPSKDPERTTELEQALSTAAGKEPGDESVRNLKAKLLGQMKSLLDEAAAGGNPRTEIWLQQAQPGLSRFLGERGLSQQDVLRFYCAKRTPAPAQPKADWEGNKPKTLKAAIRYIDRGISEGRERFANPDQLARMDAEQAAYSILASYDGATPLDNACAALGRAGPQAAPAARAPAPGPRSGGSSAVPSPNPPASSNADPTPPQQDGVLGMSTSQFQKNIAGAALGAIVMGAVGTAMFGPAGLALWLLVGAGAGFAAMHFTFNPIGEK